MDADHVAGFVTGAVVSAGGAGADDRGTGGRVLGDSCVSGGARQRRQSDEIGGLHFERLRAVRHGDWKIHYLRAGDWQRAIAGAGGSVAADGRGNRVAAGTKVAAVARSA